MAFINLSRKYVFLATARAASTSCYNELENISKLNHDIYITHRDERPDLYHIGLKEFIINYPQFSDFYIFSTVRDPHTRLISSWNEFRKIDRHLGWSHRIKQCDDISEFLDTFNNNLSRISVHFIPQYLQLNSLRGRTVDKVMYYESLGQDFTNVTKLLYGNSYYLTHTSRITPKIYYPKIIRDRLLKCVLKHYMLDINKYYKNLPRYNKFLTSANN